MNSEVVKNDEYYAAELKKIIKESAKQSGEDFATQISILVELAGFDYEVYVDLPGHFEEVLATQSSNRNDEYMAQEAMMEEMHDDEEIIDDDDGYYPDEPHHHPYDDDEDDGYYDEDEDAY